MYAKIIIYFLFLTLATVVSVLIWGLINFFEGRSPQLHVEMPMDRIGKTSHITLNLTEDGTGLRSIEVNIKQGEKDVNILKRSYEKESFLRGSKVKKEKITLIINPLEIGLKDGNATIILRATDYSLRNGGKGNKTEITKNVYIDLISPRINLLSKHFNFTQGGTGFVAFEVNEEISKGQVKIRDLTFPIYEHPKKGKNAYVSFFAIPIGEPTPREFTIEVDDLALNKGVSHIKMTVKKRAFNKDIISLSDDTIKALVDKLMPYFPEIRSGSYIEGFQKINSIIRPTSDSKLLELTTKSRDKILWQDEFILLPNSAVRAHFGDQRTYIYNKEKIDYSFHFGIDLASTQEAPVPASNNGVVVFAGYLGIYGDTVVIDHGMGLFSSYSHLSTIEVKVGDEVKKGQIIGKTGTSGLALGDHLHFSMMIHGNFVNPIEWVDKKWINDKILNQM